MGYGDMNMPNKKDNPVRGKKQLYRFKATFPRRQSIWCRIDILGKQTLADFDTILREAFSHDTSDHLSGFWKLTKQGNKYHETELGDVSPHGGGHGADQTIADLKLKAGSLLKYVYDFGDWIEHRITLEKIIAPEPNVDYPLITARNKPRYRYCQTCKAEGRKNVATWWCVDCSNEGRKRVILCEDCLEAEHDDHYTEEMQY